MKHFYLLLLAVFAIQITQAQIVNIPDTNFKSFLTSNYGYDINYNEILIDANNDGEIQISEAEAIIMLEIWGTNITSLEGIAGFVNLESLYCGSVNITSLNLNYNINLLGITIDDVSSLKSILMKNGVNSSLSFYFYSEDPNSTNNVEYICADDSEVGTLQASYPSILINTYCASESAGDTVYNIEATNLYDVDIDGCDASDTPINHVTYSITDGTQTAITQADENGEISFPVGEGTHTITAFSSQNTGYYNATPANAVVNFPADGSVFNQQYCIVPNGTPIIYFPDEDFKNALLNQTPIIDTNNDGYIQISEAEATTSISIGNSSISNLEGLEYFTNLVSLSIVNTNIESINVAQFTSLESLNVSENLLTQLDVSQNTNLVSLSCGNYSLICELYGCSGGAIPSEDWVNNNIDNLDVSQNPNLVSLNIQNGGVSNLTLNNPNLVTLEVAENPLNGLNVTQSPNLETLIAYNANLTALDLSQNPLLSAFSCYSDYFYVPPYFATSASSSNYDLPNDNNITTLDISNNSLITQLLCFNNGMQNLIIGENPNINFIRCEKNNITSLDLSGCSALEHLETYNNDLTTLTLNGNTNLEWIECYNNQITSLDLSDSTALTYLFCYNNMLTTLDLNNNSNMIGVWANNNPLTTVKVKNESEFVTEYFEGAWRYRFNIDTADLEYICADDFEIDEITNKYPSVSGIIDSSCPALSIEESEISSFKIYPNPVNNTLFIDGIHNITAVTIYDISGRLINQVSNLENQNNVEISTENLTQGTYFVKVKTEFGELVKKLVKE